MDPSEAVEIVQEPLLGVLAGVVEDSDGAAVAALEDGLKNLDVLGSCADRKDLAAVLVAVHIHAIQVEADQMGEHLLEKLAETREMVVAVVEVVHDAHVLNALCPQALNDGDLVLGFSKPAPVVVEADFQTFCRGDPRRGAQGGRFGGDALFLLLGAGELGRAAPTDHPKLRLDSVFFKKRQLPFGFRIEPIGFSWGGGRVEHPAQQFDAVLFQRDNFVLEKGDVFAPVIVHEFPESNGFEHGGALLGGAFGLVERDNAPGGEIVFVKKGGGRGGLRGGGGCRSQSGGRRERTERGEEGEEGKEGGTRGVGHGARVAPGVLCLLGEERQDLESERQRAFVGRGERVGIEGGIREKECGLFLGKRLDSREFADDLMGTAAGLAEVGFGFIELLLHLAEEVGEFSKVGSDRPEEFVDFGGTFLDGEGAEAHEERHGEGGEGRGALDDDLVIAGEVLKEPGNLDDLRVEGFGGEEEDREIRGGGRDDVLRADVCRAGVDAVFEGLLGRALGGCIGGLGGCNEALIVFERELAVDREEDGVTMAVGPGEFDGELHDFSRTGARLEVGLVLGGWEKLAEEVAQLDLSPDAACFHVGHDAAEVDHVSGEGAHFAEALLDGFESIGDLLKAFAEARAQSAGEFFVHGGAHLLEPRLGCRLDLPELEFDGGAQFFARGSRGAGFLSHLLVDAFGGRGKQLARIGGHFLHGAGDLHASAREFLAERAGGLRLGVAEAGERLVLRRGGLEDCGGKFVAVVAEDCVEFLALALGFVARVLFKKLQGVSEPKDFRGALRKGGFHLRGKPSGCGGAKLPEDAGEGDEAEYADAQSYQEQGSGHGNRGGLGARARRKGEWRGACGLAGKSGDGIFQGADSGDGDSDAVSGGEGEVIRGDDAGAGEKESAVREGVVAPKPGGEFREGAFHLGEGRGAIESGEVRAFDFQADGGVGSGNVAHEDSGAEGAAVAPDLGLGEVERIFALDVPGAEIIGDGVSEDFPVGIECECKFRLGNVPAGVGAQAHGFARGDDAVRSGFEEEFGPFGEIHAVVEGPAAGVLGFLHPGVARAQVRYARRPDLLGSDGGEKLGG
ncbi:MAG: hypothetical protein RLZZ244_2493 [Verrucomicrobiota bacterium]